MSTTSPSFLLAQNSFGERAAVVRIKEIGVREYLASSLSTALEVRFCASTYVTSTPQVCNSWWRHNINLSAYDISCPPKFQSTHCVVRFWSSASIDFRNSLTTKSTDLSTLTKSLFSLQAHREYCGTSAVMQRACVIHALFFGLPSSIASSAFLIPQSTALLTCRAALLYFEAKPLRSL